VFPVALGGAAHHQQTARRQRQVKRIDVASMAMPEIQGALLSQAQRGDNGIGPEFRFVVGV
jgi:hypothetical protein